ncbi:MAG TPA: pyruvate kinase, partial [Chthoniobacterales bacterium]|nr:pyruvate kinase [Chthoniobacterales bacterium]
MPNTKIVATLGPATDAPGVLQQIFDGGVDVFRMNASHGTHEEHEARIQAVRAIAQKAGSYPGILLDLQGPKIRLGRFENKEAVLQAGATFTITTKSLVGNSEIASTGYTNFGKDVKAGDRILLCDGDVELRAIASDEVAVRTEVVTGGRIGDHK